MVRRAEPRVHSLDPRASRVVVPDGRALQEQADDIAWFHSIDLGNGVRTRGSSTTRISDDHFPSLEGRSVLDIGAWDGLYSFMAEQRGASRVVALDHYAWGVDFQARDAYWNECIARGALPDQSRDVADFWRPDLPGRRGFEFAAAALRSRVEPIVADFAAADLSELGAFDVVFYLGVLYHMQEPLTCLERLRSVTANVAVIETQAVHLQHLEQERLLQFYAGDEMNRDFSNWYVPTEAALHSMCRAAGFSSVRTIVGPPPPAELPRRRFRPPSRGPVSAPTCFYRLLVHAIV